jgi:hypothetical protein
MPATKPNQAFRVVVPLVLIAVVIGLAILAFTSSRPSGPGSTSGTAVTVQPSTNDTRAEADADASDEPGTSAAGQGPESESEPEPDAAPESEPERATEPPVPTPSPESGSVPSASDSSRPEPASTEDFDPASLRARVQPAEPMPTLGSLDPASGHLLRVQLSPTGAGIEQILSTEHFVTVADRLAPPAEREHYVIQQRSMERTPFGEFALTPLATRTVLINNQPIDLHGSSTQPLWRIVEATLRNAILEADIVDANDQPVATVRKTLRLDEGSHLIRVTHELVNHTDRGLSVRWLSHGPLDMPTEAGGAYGGAVMRVRFGYLLDPASDPTQSYVEADRKLQRTMEVVRRLEKSRGMEGDDILWPDPKRFDVAGQLVWFAQASRYFATAILPDFERGVGMSKALDAAQQITGTTVNGRLLTGMLSATAEVEPGATA